MNFLNVFTAPFPLLCVYVLPVHSFGPLFLNWNICLFPNHLQELFKDTPLLHMKTNIFVIYNLHFMEFFDMQILKL